MKLNATNSLTRFFCHPILWLVSLLPLSVFATTDLATTNFTATDSVDSNVSTMELAALQKLTNSGAVVSGLIIDLPEGRILAKLNPDRRLGAASLTKLLTSAATLKTWGPRRTFITRIAGPAPKQGIVNGDLVFIGGGDPALNTSGIWQLAAQLAEQGIHQISGNLVIDQSLFGDVQCQSDDRCKALAKSRHSYDAPLSAAGINFGTWCVSISPATQSGLPARTRLCQLAIPTIDIAGQVDTVAKESGYIDVSRISKSGFDKLFVSGKINERNPEFRFYRSVGNAPLQTGLVLREALERIGITITGDIQVKSSRSTHHLNTLAKLESIPLAEQLIKMMTYSNNYMADVLALNLLAESPDAQRPLTLKAAGQKLSSINSMDYGDGDNTVILNSGSGLTPENALSASDIVSVLKTMYLRTDLFPAFVGSLTVPSFSPSIFYRSKSSDWRTRIATKTGSMNDPVTILGFAGYFRKRDGNWGAFALLINGTKEHPHVPYVERTHAIKETVNQLLQRY